MLAISVLVVAEVSECSISDSEIVVCSQDTGTVSDLMKSLDAHQTGDLAWLPCKVHLHVCCCQGADEGVWVSLNEPLHQVDLLKRIMYAL